jgi:glycosyltransferase involved in cell wall biosynthesis
MKVAIISCYGEGEANSEYTQALEKEIISMGHTTEILRLPFAIFGNSSTSGRKQADDLINQYAHRLKEFDYVNIHYEYLLFGRKDIDVLSHMLTLIKFCTEKAFSVVFHNFPEDKIFKPLKLKIRQYRKKLSPALIAQVIFQAVAQKKGTAICHIFRHANFIKACCPKINVVVMPLRYQKNELLEQKSQLFSRSKYMAENGIALPENIRAVSIIGTLHPYKDYFTVIKALPLLPPDYHLFIFGGQHKLSFASAPTGLPYIAEAQRIIVELALTSRVHFMGYQETTEDFENACRFSDYIIMPYHENGESASASAYTALELCKHVFTSRNTCFDELNAFCASGGCALGGVATFQYDMGNFMELAEKIKSLPHKDRILENRQRFLERYSITENAKRCIGL